MGDTSSKLTDSGKFFLLDNLLMAYCKISGTFINLLLQRLVELL
ncbi:MAG: hypothetical protein NT163_12905 [Chlorobiales bacterium]|nr:hypothetical protein [Chlorobiales bacterium]